VLLRLLYDSKLAQASYLLGCSQSGEALVVDPNRDIEQYLRLAADEGLRVTHVTETHIHADFVSGARELAPRAGARLLLSGEGGRDWQYAFAAADGATLLHDGDSFKVGNIRVDVLHTPGHTPEHLAFLVTDTAATDRPIGIFTGDLLFVGDVGRPDLLERAANVAGTMDASARALFRTLRGIADLPDYLQVWPGHGAGSACGKALGAVPQTTIGYERLTNWALAEEDEDTFVGTVLAGQPEPPRYFAEMKRINRDGPALRGDVVRPPRLGATTLADALRAGAAVVDVRKAVDFARGHVPGTMSIPYNRSFTTWAGSLLSYDRGIVLLADDGDPRLIDAIARDLAMIGLDRVEGWYGLDALSAWLEEGQTLQTTPQWTAADLAPRLAKGDVAVVDVRARSEWDAGHLPGVPNVPLATLAEHLDALPRDRPLVLHCQGGGRSSIAAAMLQARGFDNVINLAGGFTGWRDAGHEVERADETESNVGTASVRR
jgi:hydroxyacylglutathione hydrolase